MTVLFLLSSIVWLAAAMFWAGYERGQRKMVDQYEARVSALEDDADGQ